ncbi:unnamed protein product [Orchesella dallaii]|uniref:Haloacid dehalogenase-like hydrolase domain-containing protein 2 n=1 Tax=Orchesella dallaii TaxID=48710 RepID=A0ABP1PVY2_9HEXA
MSRNNKNSTDTATSMGPWPLSELSQGRKSLKATTALDKEKFKGDRKNPSYAIDADVEGTLNAVDRTDDDLTVLDLGKKYVDVFGDIGLVIVDLSGTMFQDLHPPLKPYAGAMEAFQLLKNTGIMVMLVTNSWKSSKKSIVDLLNSGGYDVSTEDIFTSSDACKQYLRANNLQRPYYLVEEDVLQDFAAEYHRRFDEDCVIIGVPSTQFDYRLLSKGMNLLMNGAPMIALNLMKRSVSPDVRNVFLGPGPFASMLTFCSDSEPVTMCKPYKEFYDALCKKIGWSDLDYSKVLVIGDDINEDIVGAKALGMKAILTRTGSYQVNDERTVCTGLTPDATVENFALAIRCVLAAQAVSQMTEDDFIQEEKSSRGCGSDLTASQDQVLTKKMQGYLNADYKSQRNTGCSNVVKLPSYIW